MLFRLLSKLLDYPSPALLESLPDIEKVMPYGGLEASEWIVLQHFIRTLSERDLTEAQAAYVLTFDLTPENALHLTHHIFGDDKNRGPALIDLSEYYKGFGLELASDAGNELPDYLPLVLEFAAQLEAGEARIFLSQWSRVLNQLAANLEKSESPYAPLVRLVEKHSLLGQPMAEAAA